MKKIKIIFSVILTLLFFFIAFSLNTSYIKSFDIYIYNLIQTINTDFTTTFFKIITSLASPLFVIILIILCFIFLKNEKIKKAIVLNALFIVILNQTIKFMIARPRPEGLMLISENGYSFPSAHAMFSLTFYGLFIYFIYHSNLNNKLKIFLYILLVTIIILVPFSRIYLGVHYASDVIAGLFLSGSVLLLYDLFTTKNRDQLAK